MKKPVEQEMRIIPKPDHVSWEELTNVIRLAYAERKESGMDFLATYQDVETTKKRVGDGLCLVALIEDSLVGAVTLRSHTVTPHNKKWYVGESYIVFSQLAVHPDHKGKGIGSKLLKKVIQTSVEWQIDELICDTSIHAKDLLTWYKRYGFQAVELLSYSTTNYYSVVLRKPINGKKFNDSYIKRQYIKSALKVSLRFNKNGQTRKIWKNLVSDNTKHRLRTLKWRSRLRKREKIERKLIAEISKKEKLRVAFFISNEAMWKYDRLYSLFKNSQRFDPVIFICPFKSFGEVIMEQELEQTFKNFKARKYKVVKTLKDDGELLDVKVAFNPDLVFFSSPWNLTDKKYQIENYMDKLSCYVNYSYTTSTLYSENYNQLTHNYCWKYFVESKIHQKAAQKYSYRKGKNTEVFGYPGLDNLLDPNYQPKEMWKPQNERKKRIIWAPHHSIHGGNSKKSLLDYSTFLNYADFMFEIADQFQKQLQIAFKPHPNLKGKLFRAWGEEKTNNYYKKWKDLSNGQLAEGPYIDLFLKSDAMIHDCGSFLIEYLCVHKPVLYLIKNEKSAEQYSDLGKKALSKMQLGHAQKDILNFIEHTVLGGKDEYQKDRERFFNDYLLPPNNKLASENIYEFLKKELTG